MERLGGAEFIEDRLAGAVDDAEDATGEIVEGSAAGDGDEETHPIHFAADETSEGDSMAVLDCGGFAETGAGEEESIFESGLEGGRREVEACKGVHRGDEFGLGGGGVEVGAAGEPGFELPPEIVVEGEGVASRVFEWEWNRDGISADVGQEAVKGTEPIRIGNFGPTAEGEGSIARFDLPDTCAAEAAGNKERSSKRSEIRPEFCFERKWGIHCRVIVKRLHKLIGSVDETSLRRINNERNEVGI